MDEFALAVDEVGGQSAMARAIGYPVRQGHVWKWLRSGIVPAEHCPAVELATKGRRRCERLRPDLDWVRDRKGRVTHYQVKVGVAA